MNYKNGKIKKYVSFLLVCIMLAGFINIFISPKKVDAQVPFGGKILWVDECGCSGGILLMVYDLFSKSPIPIVFQYGISRLNASYNIFTPSVNVLGSYTPGGICLMAKTECGGFPVIGTITPPPLPGIGTSLSPSF